MINRRWGWLLLVLGAMLGRAGALEVAVVPPVADQAVVDALRLTAAAAGITVSVLDPAQLVDPHRFTPSIYAMAVLAGGEQYPDTIIDEGDAAAALRRYSDEGGALLVVGEAPALTRPQRWDGAAWKGLSAPVRRLELAGRLGVLDAGLSLESPPPADAQFVVDEKGPLADKLPARFAMPSTTLPFMPVPQNQPTEISFQPIATLVAADGATYGAGLALCESRGQASNGPVFYAWAPLLTSELGGPIVLGMLQWQAARHQTPEQSQKQAELLNELAELDRLRGLAEEVLPPTLQTPALDEIRDSLTTQAETLRWLREAAQTGNLTFVGLRIPALREELSGLPVRIGTEVDQAVEAAVSQQGAVPVTPREAPRSSAPVQSTEGGATVSEPASSGATEPGAEGPRGATEPMTVTRDEPAATPATDAGGEPATTPAEGGEPATAPATAGGEPVTDPATAPPAAPQVTDVPAPDAGDTGTTAAVPPVAPVAGEASAPAAPTPPTATTPPATDPGAPATDPAGEGTTVAPTPLVTPEGDRAAAPQLETRNPVVALEIADRGTIYIELYPEQSPKTCSAFMFLVRSGFYTGTYFHRREERFVVQGGDPLTKTLDPDHRDVGTGGPAWTVPGEFSRELHHKRGTVGLARAPRDPDSGGSQFYICLEAQPSLDGEYAILGQVVQGLEVVDRLQVGDRITRSYVVQGAEETNPPDSKPLELDLRPRD